MFFFFLALVGFVEGWQAGNQATTGAGGMSVSGPSRVRHLFALSRWILQGFNPIYEFRFSFFGKAKYLILFCRRPCSALGFIFHEANQPAASREASPNRRDVAWQRAVSGMRQVASGKCQCEWQDNVGAVLRGEWQRQVQRVALYYAYRTQSWGGTATGLDVAPLPLTWPVTLTSLMKNSLIMRTFLIHMRPGNLPRQINPPAPEPGARAWARAGPWAKALLHPSIRATNHPSINQSIATAALHLTGNAVVKILSAHFWQRL